MQFPSRTGRVFLVLSALILVPLVLAALAGGWLAWTLPPLQKIYLNSYAASTAGAGLPHSQTTIRWVPEDRSGIPSKRQVRERLLCEPIILFVQSRNVPLTGARWGIWERTDS